MHQLPSGQLSNIQGKKPMENDRQSNYCLIRINMVIILVSTIHRHFQVLCKIFRMKGKVQASKEKLRALTYNELHK